MDRGKLDIQEELGVTAHNGLDQGVSVLGGFGERLAEGEGVVGLIGSEVEVVRGDGCWES